MMKIKNLFVDLLCGAGGTSTGLHRAKRRLPKMMNEHLAEVVACVNHDKNAIKSHQANFKDTLHFTEDFRTVKIALIKKALEERKQYWESQGYKVFTYIWASLECTNFSKAKGGMSRDADSRTLGEHLYKYIEQLDTDFVWIENVEEYLEWGPLLIKELQHNKKKGIEGPHCPLRVIKVKKTKEKPAHKIFGPVWIPDKEQLSIYYNAWRDHIKGYGYAYEYQIINSADHGERTSRKRYYAQFAKGSLPIVWPEETHAKNPKPGTKKKKWRPVKPCLDLSNEGVSIFNRKKPLSPNTFKRVFEGAVKHIAGGHGNYSAMKSGYQKVEMTQHQFLTQYYSGGGQTASINNASPCLPTKDRISLCSFNKLDPETKTIVYNWIDKQYSGSANHQSINSSAGTLRGNDKHCLMTAKYACDGSVVKHWIMNTSFNNIGSSINDPAPVLLASRKHHYVVNPAWGGNSGSVDNPCCTLVARQDKAPLYLLAVEYGAVAIAVYDTDSEIEIQLKEFMALFGIVDIKMRMFEILEMLRIQGFGEKYILIGSKTEQKKYIGNSVNPEVPKRMVEKTTDALIAYMSHKLIAA